MIKYFSIFIVITLTSCSSKISGSHLLEDERFHSLDK